MKETWTPLVLAGELFDMLPGIGRIIHHYVLSTGEEKSTFMQVRTMAYLLERPLTTSDLAKKRQISLQSASALVQGLVERGWVVRVPDPNDRRQSQLKVTPEGKAQARLAKEQTSNYLAGLLEELSPEEIAAGQVFLTALKRVLKKHFVPDELEN
jgi:DNA-binding MarR family transcriptional regulator